MKSEQKYVDTRLTSIDTGPKEYICIIIYKDPSN